jgi:hypothetical protein
MTASSAAGSPSGQDYAGVPPAATSAALTHLEQEHEDHHLPQARDHLGPRVGHHLGTVTPYEPAEFDRPQGAAARLLLARRTPVRPSMANSAGSQTWGRPARAARAGHPRTPWGG